MVTLTITDPSYPGNPLVYANGEPVIGKRDPNRWLKGEIRHIATIFETAENPNFTPASLVKEACFYGIIGEEGDRVNKLFKCFPDAVLDPNKQYWARAKVLLETGPNQGGWSTISNIALVDAKEANDLTKTNEFPTKVSVPIISTSCNPGCHAKTHFRIYVSGYSVIGTANLTAVSYIIEDTKGRVVWRRLEDKLNTKNILVDDVTLEEGKAYFIKAYFHTSTGDTSQAGMKPIFIDNATDIIINEQLIGLNNSEEIKINVITPKPVDKIDYHLVAYRNNLYKEEYFNTSDTNIITIPQDTLVSGQAYLLMVKTNLSSGYRIEEITGYSAGQVVNPDLSSGNDSPDDTDEPPQTYKPENITRIHEDSRRGEK